MSIDASLTIRELLERAVRQHATEPALISKWNGRFEAETWNDLLSAVCRFMTFLGENEVRSQDRAVHIAPNSRGWVLFDLACHLAGVVHVPLHASLSPSQLIEQIRHSEARCVFVDSDDLQQKLASLNPEGIRVVRYGSVRAPTVSAKSWENYTAYGGTARPDDLATILYTSGTTGEPKGVMLTQRNLSSNAQAVVETFGETEQREVRLNILPLSHIFARTCDLYAWLVRGSTLAIAESRDTVMEDLQSIKPTTINGVPYFYERLRRVLCEKGYDKTPGALRQLLGGEIRSCCSGGAALPPATIDYFAAQEVPLLQGYGLTETSPVITMSTRALNRPGTCGRALPGIDLRIAEDGEVLTRGPHVMLGYYKNAIATAEVIRDGWLHTGDMGHLDADSFLRIIGRKKEMIVLSTGKKIAPSLIENRLSQDSLVAQAIVVGEGQSHLGALVVPQREALCREIEGRRIVTSPEQSLAHPDVQAIYLQRFRELLADLSPQEQVHHVALLPRGFSMEQGEMTAKLSLRREVICHHFAHEIERMYQRPC